MATTGQNITIHELDKFQVTFTVTDAVNTLAQSLAECWWGVAPAVNSGYSSWVMQKATDGWNTAGAGNESVANHGGLTIGSTTITIEAKLSNDGSHYTGSVNIPNGTYYHECVYSPLGTQQGSTVIATGTLTCLESLYTKANYRK